MSHMQQSLSIQTHWLHFLGVGLFFTVAGLCMIYWAWRGKRVGDRPFCAKCDYDLSGLIDTADTCPECGSELTKHRSVVRGHRQLRSKAMIIAILVVLISLAGLSSTGYRAYHEVNWYLYKPMAWLLPDTVPEYALNTQPNTDELIRRLDDRLLTDVQKQALVRELLKIHASVPAWKDEKWKLILHTLLADRSFTQQQVEQLIKQSFSVTFDTRPVLRKKRFFRYETRRILQRLGAGWGSTAIKFRVGFGQSRLLLDGLTYRLEDESGLSKRVHSDFNTSHGLSAIFSPPKPKQDIAGDAMFEYRLGTTIQLIQPVEYEPVTFDAAAFQKVKIVDRDAIVDTFIEDDKYTSQMNAAWFGTRVISKGANKQVWVRIDNPPINLSMGVWVLDGKHEKRIGDLRVTAYTLDKWYRIDGYDNQDWSDQVIVQLRPDQTPVDSQMMLNTYWGKAMQRENIVVNAPYTPPFNMDTSFADQLPDVVTINTLKRLNEKSVSIRLSYRKSPVRLCYLLKHDGDAYTSTANIESGSSWSTGEVLYIKPDMKQLTIQLLPSNEWEQYGQLTEPPSCLGMLFENIPIPKADEYKDRVWFGKVVIPEQ